MSDNYQCQYCKMSDGRVLEGTQWHHDWLRGWFEVRKFYAHPECSAKEMSTSGDGHGVGVTA